MGTRSATSEVKISWKSTLKNLLDDGIPATVNHGQTLVNQQLADGVETDEANRPWEDRDRELASGADEDIDIFDFAGQDIGAGAGNDGTGQALTIEEVVFIAIVHTGGDGQLEITPSASDGWTPIGEHTVALGGALREGGVFLKHQPHAAGFDVVDGASHKINLKAVGGDLTYTIAILGRSDDEASSSSSSVSSSSSSRSSSSSLSSSSSQSSLSSGTSLSSVSSVSSLSSTSSGTSQSSLSSLSSSSSGTSLSSQSSSLSSSSS